MRTQFRWDSSQIWMWFCVWKRSRGLERSDMMFFFINFILRPIEILGSYPSPTPLRPIFSPVMSLCSVDLISIWIGVNRFLQKNCFLLHDEGQSATQTWMWAFAPPASIASHQTSEFKSIQIKQGRLTLLNQRRYHQSQSQKLPNLKMSS